VAYSLIKNTRVEFWEYDKSFKWREGIGRKLFTVDVWGTHSFTRIADEPYSYLHLTEADVPESLFHTFLNSRVNTPFHLIVKAEMYSHSYNKYLDVAVRIPFAKLHNLEGRYESNENMVAKVDMSIGAVYGQIDGVEVQEIIDVVTI
jgi:hypothetical protein